MAGLLSYARAALPLVPGASRLPFVAGGGGEIPALERSREGVRIDRSHLAAYKDVCGFTGEGVPATYPHMPAFGLHLALMTDGSFPFPAVGLVHIANQITQHRPLEAGESFDLVARTTPAEPHPKGMSFSILTEAHAGGERVWEERSTMLRRGRPHPEARNGTRRPQPPRSGGEHWELPGDLGRSYGAVSGDRNPIHIHPLTARMFGFPRAIAHGMWTKARCLAALGERPVTFTVEVEFGKPILLPGTVRFANRGERFAVRDAERDDIVHLDGSVTA